MFRTGIVSIVMCCLWGCAAHKPASLTTPEYHEEEIIYRYQYAMTNPVQQDGMEFRDETLFCRVLPKELSIGLDIINVSEIPISIDWNQVRLIDSDGTPHPVVHGMVLLRDLQRANLPTVIMPQGVLNESVAPSDYAYLDFSGWQQRPIFPKTVAALGLQGMRFGVAVPVQIKGAVKNYLFEIEVTGVVKDVIIR